MHQKLNLLMYLSHGRVLTTLSDIGYAQNLHLASTNERKESLKVRVRCVNVRVCVSVKGGKRERESESENREQQTTSSKRRLPLRLCASQTTTMMKPRCFYSHTKTNAKEMGEKFPFTSTTQPTARQGGRGDSLGKR